VRIAKDHCAILSLQYTFSELDIALFDARVALCGKQFHEFGSLTSKMQTPMIRGHFCWLEFSRQAAEAPRNEAICRAVRQGAGATASAAKLACFPADPEDPSRQTPRNQLSTTRHR
jgi:hypothetical protein